MPSYLGLRHSFGAKPQLRTALYPETRESALSTNGRPLIEGRSTAETGCIVVAEVLLREVADMPVPETPSGVIVGRSALAGGALGLVAGLVRGLEVYAPTAWAAMFEVGIPSAGVGAVIGFGIVGGRRLRAQQRSSGPTGSVGAAGKKA